MEQMLGRIGVIIMITVAGLTYSSIQHQEQMQQTIWFRRLMSACSRPAAMKKIFSCAVRRSSSPSSRHLCRRRAQPSTV